MTGIGWEPLAEAINWPTRPVTLGDPAAASRTIIRPAGTDLRDRAVTLNGAAVSTAHDGRVRVTLFHPTLRDNDCKRVVLALAVLTPFTATMNVNWTCEGILDGLRMWTPGEAETAARDAEWLWLPDDGFGDDDVFGDQPVRTVESVTPMMRAWIGVIP